MTLPLRIGIVGDFDAAVPSHLPTNESIRHAAEALGVDVDIDWLGTERWTDPAELAELDRYDGLWAAPGSPYRSLEGALVAIRTARERGLPFTGT
jgi:CTP synthase (UTP-ammonia lyase)